MSKPLCIIVGYGPGVGHGIAKAYGNAGFSVGLIARNLSKVYESILQLKQIGLEANFVEADVVNGLALESAIDDLSINKEVDVLIYNAVAPTFCKPSKLEPSKLITDFQVNVVGALIASQAVLPKMRARNKGCILFTGGGWAHYPWDEASSIGIGKAGLRSLAFVLSQELSDTDIRVGMVSIMGQVSHETQFNPNDIGQSFLDMFNRRPEQYEIEYFFK